MNSYETNDAKEFRDIYGLLHNTSGPALIKQDRQEFYEHGIWQKTILKNGIEIQIPTNKSTFEDHYGTRHYFKNNLHHGSPSIESLAGVKYYHNNGVLIAQLMPDASLYYDFQDNVPTKYTDKTGTTYHITNQGWQVNTRYFPGKRTEIKTYDNTAVEVWTDPFGSRYDFRNGIIYQMHSGTKFNAVIEFSSGMPDVQCLIDKNDHIIIPPIKTDQDGNEWQYKTHYEIKITTPRGNIIETYCSRVVKEQAIVLNGTLRSGHLSKIEIAKAHQPDIYDQIKPYIPTDKHKWFAYMEPIFKEYQLNETITNILNASKSDNEFLAQASASDIQTYQKRLQQEFYDEFHKALRVGQALRLFKHDSSIINDFAEAVQKTREELLLYCCKTLFENNPNHIKLLCEVKW